MASVLQSFMEEYNQSNFKLEQEMAIPATEILKEQAPKDPFATRKQRRVAVAAILIQMEQLLFAEERYRDNIPENLQGSKWYEGAETSIAVMNEVIDLMSEIY